MSAYEDLPVEVWELSKLKPNPKQTPTFGPPNPEVVSQIRKAIRAGKHPPRIHISRDGTIHAGHSRAEAYRLEGYETIEVIVRDDLADNPEAAERFFIEDNLDRRQLSKIAMASLVRQVKSLELQERARLREADPSSVRISVSDNTSLRDKIGRRLGMSGRTLDRYARIVEQCPDEVIQALDSDDDDNKITVTQAEKIAGLNRDEMSAFKNLLAESENAAVAVKAFLSRGTPAVTSIEQSLDKMLRAVFKAKRELEGQPDGTAIPSSFSRHLGEAKAFLSLLADLSNSEVVADEEQEADGEGPEEDNTGLGDGISHPPEWYRCLPDDD